MRHRTTLLNFGQSEVFGGGWVVHSELSVQLNKISQEAKKKRCTGMERGTGNSGNGLTDLARTAILPWNLKTH